MAKDFETVAGTPYQKPLWNYNLGRNLGNGGAFLPKDGSLNVALGTNLPTGTLLYVNLSNRQAYAVKNALVLAGGTTSAPRVDKRHLFVANDVVFVSGAAVTITSIDSSNSAYDVFTLSGACAGAIAGSYLEYGVAAGADPVVKYKPNIVLQERVLDVQGGERLSCTAWIFEDVNTSKFPFVISPLILADLNATGRYLMF